MQDSPIPSESTPPDARPYEDVRPPALILRDHLAIDRTVLANERTMLAYVRTALTLFLVGISFLHLPDLHPDPVFGGRAYGVAGWVFMAAAGVVLVIGYIRYHRFKADILNVQRKAPP